MLKTGQVPPNKGDLGGVRFHKSLSIGLRQRLANQTFTRTACNETSIETPETRIVRALTRKMLEVAIPGTKASQIRFSCGFEGLFYARNACPIISISERTRAKTELNFVDFPCYNQSLRRGGRRTETDGKG